MKLSFQWVSERQLTKPFLLAPVLASEGTEISQDTGIEPNWYNVLLQHLIIIDINIMFNNKAWVV